MSNNMVDQGLAAIRSQSGRADAGILSYFRDANDSYTIAFEPRVKELADIGKSPFFPLLPAGSHWGHGVGWRSFFTHPYRILSRRCWVVGLEGVVGHATRGGYPVMEVLFFGKAEDAVNCVRLIADAACTNRSKAAIHRGTVQSASEGYLVSTARSPEEYCGDERVILEAGITELERDGDCAIRTLAITEERLPFKSPAQLRCPRSLTGISRTSFFGYSKHVQATLRTARGGAFHWPWRTPRVCPDHRQ